VTTRTPSKVSPALLNHPSQKVQFHASARQVAEHSDVVITMVGFPHEVEDVILSKDNGALWAMKNCSNDKVIIDMSTSEPSLAQKIAQVAREQGKLHAIDAPVSGGDVGAREARLTIVRYTNCLNNKMRYHHKNNDLITLIFCLICVSKIVQH